MYNQPQADVQDDRYSNEISVLQDPGIDYGIWSVQWTSFEVANLFEKRMNCYHVVYHLFSYHLRVGSNCASVKEAGVNGDFLMWFMSYSSPEPFVGVKKYRIDD